MTEVTSTLRVPGAELGTAAGVALQPSAVAPPTANTGNTNHDLIALTIVAEGMEHKNGDIAPLVRSVAPLARLAKGRASARPLRVHDAIFEVNRGA